MRTNTGFSKFCTLRRVRHRRRRRQVCARSAAHVFDQSKSGGCFFGLTKWALKSLRSAYFCEEARRSCEPLRNFPLFDAPGVAHAAAHKCVAQTLFLAPNSPLRESKCNRCSRSGWLRTKNQCSSVIRLEGPFYVTEDGEKK